MKYDYVHPAAEVLQKVSAASFLEASGDAERDGYPEGVEFDW